MLNYKRIPQEHPSSCKLLCSAFKGGFCALHSRVKGKRAGLQTCAVLSHFLPPKAPTLPYLCRAAGSSSAERLWLCPGAQPWLHRSPRGLCPCAGGEGGWRTGKRAASCGVSPELAAGVDAGFWGALPSRNAWGSRCVPIPPCQCQCTVPSVGMLLRGDFLHFLFVWSKSRCYFIAPLCRGQCEFGGSRVPGGFAIAWKEERWLSTFFKTAWGAEPAGRQEGLT